MLFLLFLPFFVLNSEANVQLLSSSAPALSLVSGLTARFQCSVYRCGQTPKPSSLCWYKDDILLFNGTQFEPTSGVEPSRIILQRSIDTESSSGADGQNCVGEEFTLLLRNLSREDSGKYSCQLWAMPQQLDFNLDVIDGDIKLNFSSSISFDHTECCIERGVSPLCRPMCRPRDMGDEFFDPTSCQVDDYRNFLHCATNNGKRDYLPCCREKRLPPFCFDFCSNNFQTLKNTHRLCLYYLPEIFDCFGRQYAPSKVRLREDGSSKRKLCWSVEQPALKAEEAVSFQVHLREMPEMPNGVEAMNFIRAIRSKRRKRTTTKTVSSKSSKPPAITLVEETSHSQRVLFTKLHARSIEIFQNSEICIPIGASLQRGSRFLIYVQATNDFGTSEPSRPIFVTEDGQMHQS